MRRLRRWVQKIAAMRRPFVVRSIVAVLTAWALITIVPDLTRPFVPLAAIGLAADFEGRIVGVDPDGPAAAARIRAWTRAGPGDRIDFARTPRDTLFALYGGLGGRPFFLAGRRIVLDLVGPDGTRTVTLVATERHPPVLERASLLVAEFLGIGFIVLGAFLAWHFPNRRDVAGFFLYAIWFNPGQDYVFYSLLPPAMWLPQEVLSAFLQAMGLAGFVTFALRFPTDRSEGWRRPIERALPVLVAGLTILTIAGAGAEFGRPNRVLWLTVFWLKVAIYPLVVAAFVTKLRLLPPVERQRLRMVILGCIPGLFFYFLAESVDVTSLWEPLFNRIGWRPPEVLLDFGYLVNALVPISIGYAVLRRRVLPIDFIVNRTVTLGIVWVIVAMSVEATVLSAHRFLEENHVLSTLILAAVLVAAAPILERLKVGVNDCVDRFLFVRLHGAKRDLEALAQDLAAATSSETIEAAIVERPCEKLELSAAVLFALEDDGQYRVASQWNWPPEAVHVLAGDDPLVRELRDGAPEAEPRVVLRERTDLPAGAARPELALALTPNAYIEALALFSGHADGSALTPDEAVILTRFVQQCGAARAHVKALAMRREVAQLRLELARINESRRRESELQRGFHVPISDA